MMTNFTLHNLTLHESIDKVFDTLELNEQKNNFGSIFNKFLSKS
jgi:hypothetical protein